MKIIVILAILALFSCKTREKAVVYFKHPETRVKESDSHKHGHLHSPHYIPIIHDKVSDYLVLKYDVMYKEKHAEYGSKQVEKSHYWLFSYLILMFLTLI